MTSARLGRDSKASLTVLDGVETGKRGRCCGRNGLSLLLMTAPGGGGGIIVVDMVVGAQW